MSNIFEALSKSRDGIGEFMRPIVETHGPLNPIRGEAEEPDAVPPPVSILHNGTCATPGGGLLGAHTRTLRLQVAAASPLLPFEESHWQASEQYRILRTKISQHRRQPRLIVVSSAAAGDGKTTNAVNIAGVLSLKSEAKVLLVDADFRRPTIHNRLGLPQAPGLADVLTGKCALEQAMVRTQELPNLYVLCGGTTPPNPVELLDSTRWPELCRQFRDLFRYVVVDSPPVASVADYDLLQAACDGVVLVVRTDHTNRQLCRRVIDAMAKDKFLGVLLNCVPKWFLGRYTSADYYYYSGSYRSKS